MEIKLTQKERMILEDGKHQEDICVKKYQSYANLAQDQELKDLFNKLASEEQHHYNMIDQLLQGQQPNFSHSGQASQPVTQGVQENSLPFESAMRGQDDEVLCSDLLATEKHVSSLYDTGIFEAANPIVRQTLQHIQQDEQEHGEQIFNYMNSRGMYNVE